MNVENKIQYCEVSLKFNRFFLKFNKTKIERYFLNKKELKPPILLLLLIEHGQT